MTVSTSSISEAALPTASESFEAWYRDCHPRILAALTVVAGTPESARDAASEAFTRSFERWERVEHMASPEGWVYRVGVNLLRRRARRALLEHRLWARLRPSQPHTDVVVRTALASEIWAAVRSLPPRQREAIALRYVMGLSQQEVAEAMKVAPGTAAATLSAARSRVASLLVSADPLETDHD